MNWKLLILFGFCIAFGYTAIMGIQFYLSGYPFTIQNFIAFTVDGTLRLLDKISVFIQEKWQLVLSMIGVASTAIVGVYKAIQNKIAGIRQVAETQVDTAQSQVTQQYENMKGTVSGLQKIVDTRDATITDLQNQLTTLQNQSTSVQQVKDQYTQLEGSIKRIQDERDYIMGQLKDALIELEVLRPKPIS